MGIGNDSQVFPLGTGHCLITPHGDRKHADGDVHTGRYTRSLPLMGIGNATAGVPYLQEIFQLITPHGDRKHSSERAARKWEPPHYPSWGSETLGLGARGHPELQLITPHGDRKRELRFLTNAAYARLITPHGDRKRKARTVLHGIPHTHYPSWGSETREAFLALPVWLH